MNEVLQDIAFAWRNAVRSPATSLLIVVTLALGIGANSAMFSVVYQCLLAPLPYADGEKLVVLEQRGREGGSVARWSWPTLADFQRQSRTLEGLAHYLQLPLPVVGQGEPYHASAGIVSGNFFTLLGVEVQYGRGFSPDDDRSGSAPVLLLSHEFWTERFAGDPAVVGSTLIVKDVAYSVIGILPPIPPYPHRNDVWIPAASDPYLLFGLTETDSERQSNWASHALGRMSPQASVAAEENELATIAARLAEAFPGAYPQGYTVAPRALAQAIGGDAAGTLVLVMGLSFLVVLIACANVASLNLARLASRGRELATREALGADPGRITRQLLTESCLYALAGGCLGLLVAFPSLALLRDFASAYTPLATATGLHMPMLLSSLALILPTGLLSGMAAAFQHRDINRALKEGNDKTTASRTGTRGRKTLMTAQYALSFVLLTVGMLVVSSLFRLQSQQTGFRMESVLAASVMLDYDFAASYPEVREHMRNFAGNLLASAEALPGVGEAALMAGSPLLQDVDYLAPGPIEVEGVARSQSEAAPMARFQAVSEGYFRLLGIPLLRGSSFDPELGADSIPVAIVNDNVARRFFPGGDPVGRRIRFSGTQWRRIIGVVGSVRSESLSRVEDLVVYYDFRQYPTEAINLYVESSTDPGALERAVTELIHDIDPDQSIASIGPLAGLKRDGLAPWRLRARLIGVFGLLALLLTLSGVIGMVSHSVMQRVRETGVHMAAGANPTQVRMLFLGEGLKTYLTGLLAGLLLTAAGAPLIQPFLFETEALDLRLLLLSALLLTFCVLAAMYAAAGKAGALSPSAALRLE